LVRPRQRPVTNVVAVLVVVLTFLPIILSQRFARRADEH
jgi:putative spermidine/putrescine transport system permease protein